MSADAIADRFVVQASPQMTVGCGWMRRAYVMNDQKGKSTTVTSRDGGRGAAVFSKRPRGRKTLEFKFRQALRILNPWASRKREAYWPEGRRNGETVSVRPTDKPSAAGVTGGRSAPRRTVQD